MSAPVKRVVAVVHVRLGSSRLPGKSLADICGKPLLQRVIERVRVCRRVDEAIVATTAAREDDAVERLASAMGIGCYRGSVDDVLDRVYQAAVQAQADVVVRITADDPLKDPATIDLVIERFLAADVDYASNTIDPTYPEGLDVEVISRAALTRAWHEARLASEREHVTPYIWTRPETFRLLSVTREPNLSSLRWTVDYPADLEFARAVYAALGDRTAFGMDDVLALLERRPELRRTTGELARNEGYQRSLAADAPIHETAASTTVERISELERRYVLEVLETQFRSSAGSAMTRRLEEAFARRCNVRFAIAHINGTATLHAALVAAGVGPGDEVIVPPLTMASTAFAVLHANAVPVFADIDADTWTLDPVAVEKLVSPRTRAIMPVALYGLMPDMDPLMAIAARHRLVVVEDDAECFLGAYKGRVSGSIGHLSSFSFQSSKQLTAGEGGIVVTDDEDLALRVRRFNSLGYAGVGTSKAKITKEDIQDPQYARHVSMGFNYRMPELCAAVALAQTERMEELVRARMQAAATLAEAVAGCDWLVPQRTPPGYVNSYWTYVLRLAEHAPATWHQFRDTFRALGGDGIYAAWRLNYLEPAFLEGKLFGDRGSTTQRYAPGLCPVAEQVQPCLLQFKTNYWDPAAAARQAEILRRAIRACEK